MSLQDVIKRNAVKSILPMVVENIPNLECAINKFITSQEVLPGEEYVGVVLHIGIDESPTLTMCSFDYSNMIVRQIKSMPLKDFIQSLIKEI